MEPLDSGTWLVTYAPGRPIVELEFERPAGFYRERVWRIRTPGYHLARRGDRQLLELDPGASARDPVVFEVPTWTAVIPKEYELFLRFTDGAVALYTGHFPATPTFEGDSSPGDPLREVRVVPPAGEHVVIRGRTVDGPVTVNEGEGDGTYVYLGGASPIETGHLLAIVDPGMPDWLHDQFDRYLPELFDAYTQRLGASLPWKPLVLYSFRDTATSGYSSGGGTLTGVITMTLEGNAWRERNESAAAQAFHLLAHESAHLWNGQLVESPGGRESWMHEGSADAMADDLLFDFGVIDAARLRMDREMALNQCAAALAEGPLRDAAARGAFRAFYDCGAVIAYWTASAVRRADPETDLFSFWRRLIARATERGGAYDADLYFAVLSESGVEPAVIGSMRDFSADARTIDAAVRGLRAAGIAVTEGVDEPPASFQRELARRAFGHVMASACGGMNFYAGAPIVTGPIPGCEPFASEYRVFGIDGYRISDQGAAVYDAVVTACSAGSTIHLEGENGAELTRVPCTRPLPARRVWYGLPSERS